MAKDPREQEKDAKGQARTEQEILADMARRREERERRSRAPKPWMIVLLVVLVLGGALAFSLSGYFTVDSIEVEGNSYFTDEEIIQIGHASAGKNILYQLGGGKIENYLEENPYIAKAEVSRKLPSTMLIEVEERQQVAALSFDDEYLIIDNDGILLRKTETEPKLTLVSGFTVEKMTLGEKLEVKETESYDQLLQRIQDMQEADVYFIGIEMSELYIHARVYDSLVITGRYDDVSDALSKGRINAILEELFSRDIERGTITIATDGYASFTPSV